MIRGTKTIGTSSNNAARKAWALLKQEGYGALPPRREVVVFMGSPDLKTGTGQRSMPAACKAGSERPWTIRRDVEGPEETAGDGVRSVRRSGPGVRPLRLC